MNHKSIFYHCPNGPISSGLGAHVSESFKSACDQVLLHPDKSGEGTEALFVSLAEAYEVLGDEAARKTYDAERVKS